MAIIKCKMCGGDLNLVEGASTAECEYCGSVQTVPKVDDEKKLTLFARANRLRAACEFDKATGIYEAIVADFPEEAEAYWGLVLCKYGIEYVDDPATAKKIPTCHRSSFDSILEDSDFEQALENADLTARRVYRDEAKAIEEIRKGIIEVSSNEQPYDIFICYKETAEDGQRTLDSVLAQDVYDALTDKGYRVFFSRITLEDKLGVEYEPYIFAALNSAKVMLTFGTDYEYFNAVWVKNEWSRFLKLMAKDKEKHLIPCYKGIDAYDMPKEFAKLQAQDLGKVGAIQDLLRGIEKIFPLKKAKTKETVVIQQAAAPATEPLLKRMFLFLEDSDWNSASEYAEKVLDIDPECAEAYLGKLLVEMQLTKPEELKKQTERFDARNFYKKTIRFAEEGLRSTLEGYLAEIQKDLDKKQRAEEKLREEDRTARALGKDKLLLIRQKLQLAQGILAAGNGNTYAVTLTGTVLSDGTNQDGERNVGRWRDIIAISAGTFRTVGLKADGTVIMAGDNDFGVSAVNQWRDIAAVSTSYGHIVGLKADGTVVAAGLNEDGQCNVGKWKGIVAVSAGYDHTVGLKADGTVVAAGLNEDKQCDVTGWRDIVAISAGHKHTVGLKADGSVVAVGNNEEGQCKVSRWREIVAISASEYHTVGLKSNGTVVAAGDKECFTLDKDVFDEVESDVTSVTQWNDIVAISAGNYHTVGLKKDGAVVELGARYNESTWKLFHNFEQIDQARSWCRAGACTYCGGEFKGFFTKKCVACGKPKDY